MTDITQRVLDLVAQERARQDAKFGDQSDLPFTRPRMSYLENGEQEFKGRYELRKNHDLLSHADIILEETAEAIYAYSPGLQLEEAIQAAACWVKAIEAMLKKLGK